MGFNEFLAPNIRTQKTRRPGWSAYDPIGQIALPKKQLTMGVIIAILPVPGSVDPGIHPNSTIPLI